MKSLTFSSQRQHTGAKVSLPTCSKTLLCALFAVFWLLQSFVVVWAQSVLELGGKYKLLPSTVYAAAPLTVATPLNEALKSGYYVSGVGGVAFDGVAMPMAGLQIDSLRLVYNPELEDGNRLTVLINGQTCGAPNLPDWQLVPIAKFADSPYYACVTLFGELMPGVRPPPEAQYVVGYHPAFENTLLGLRIFQTDFYLLDPTISGELPKRDGEYILGHGEAPPNPAIWQEAAYQLNQLFGSGQQFQSYVICDYQRQVTFAIDSSRLALDNYPYFYFWRQGKPRVEEIEKDGQRIRITNSFEVVHIKELSDKISSPVTLLHEANPAVYNSLVAVMRYSAFFRYCKLKHPDMWSAFLERIAPVRIHPEVITPSIVQ